MATVVRNKVKVRSLDQPIKTETHKSVTTDSCVEIRLSNRDRNTLLSVLNSTQPNRSLMAAAKKYKKQCA